MRAWVACRYSPDRGTVWVPVLPKLPESGTSALLQGKARILSEDLGQKSMNTLTLLARNRLLGRTAPIESLAGS
jgi:hypothetical protein